MISESTGLAFATNKLFADYHSHQSNDSCVLYKVVSVGEATIGGNF